jgi:hypothetical protein
MKFVINAKEYDLDSINRLTLWDTLEMEKQSGLTLDALSERGTAMQEPGAGVDMLVVAVLVWMSRRKAGEILTLEQACDFELTDFEIIADEEPEETSAADPQTA